MIVGSEDDNDPKIIAERLRVLTARMDESEKTFATYISNAIKAVALAAGYILWEPIKHLLQLAGLLP